MTCKKKTYARMSENRNRLDRYTRRNDIKIFIVFFHMHSAFFILQQVLPSRRICFERFRRTVCKNRTNETITEPLKRIYRLCDGVQNLSNKAFDFFQPFRFWMPMVLGCNTSILNTDLPPYRVYSIYWHLICYTYTAQVHVLYFTL